MEFILQFMGLLVKVIVVACTIALILIFLATLITLLGLQTAIVESWPFLSGQSQFFEDAREFMHQSGDFFLREGHRLLGYAIIGGMIYFVLSILKHW